MDTKQYMDLLKRGPQVWNDWRERHPDIQPNFHEEDLSEVLLRNMDLHEVDLTQVHGLTAEQLGGANLSGAQLSATIQKFERLAEVDTLAQNGQKLVFSLLLACLYTWLTVATTTDVRLLTNSASSPLPLVGTAIPIVGFYIIAPLILLSLYLYCHLYLQRYWEGLAALPAIFPDGRSLDRRTYPWLLSDLVHSHFALLKKDRSFLSPLQVWLPAFLAWAVVPLTLFLFWGRYLSRHDWNGTILHTLLLATAIGFGLFSYLLARATLRGVTVRQYERSRRVLASSLGAIVSTLFVFLFLSFGVMYGAPPSDPFDPNPRNSLAELVPQALSFLGLNPFADFTGAEVSVKPENWNRADGNKAESNGTESEIAKSGKKISDKPEDGADVCAGKDSSESESSDETPIQTVISTVKGAHLRNRNLRYALASHAFLVNADLRDADLRGVNFAEADLRGANLEGADLRNANLSHVDLREANLKRANLWGAYLGEARLQNAVLQGASLGDANLEWAKLQGAQLQEDKVSDSPYRFQEISGADLQRAKLWGADFSKAKLQGVKFWQAELDGADFSGAHLEHAQFQRSSGKANFSHACLLGAYPPDSSLSIAEKATTKQLEFAIKDRKTPTSDFTEQHEEQLLGVAQK